MNDDRQEWGISPMPLGPQLKAEFPFVDEAVRFSESSTVVQYEERVCNEVVHFAEPAFFDLITFPLRLGTSDLLSDPGQITTHFEL
ncbi:MAG: putative ABC transport system permease protein [Rhodothermales bacterium]